MPFPRVLSLSPESRTQCLPLGSPHEGAAGRHEASPQPALLWAGQTKGSQLLLVHLTLFGRLAVGCSFSLVTSDWICNQHGRSLSRGMLKYECRC
uniref:Uncharacterized protein n=1 Tax=Anas platyrhynchos platyrhynchos TaxID=8840 RepID=A0A493SXP9_ANAPP